MILHRPILSAFLSLALALGWHGTALADSTITIFPAGSGAFTLRGELLEKVSTLDISVDYNAGTLGNPSASCGSLAAKALCEINSGTSGIVQIRIKSATSFSGMGILASLNFTRLGDDPGTINSLDASLADVNGDPIAVQTNVVNPTPEQAGRKTPPLRKEVKAGSSQGASAGGGAQPATSTPVAGNAEGRKVVQPGGMATPCRRLESVLDRFYARANAASLDTLLPLFDTVPAGEVRQDPPIVLTDGVGTARLTVEHAGDGTTPNFLIRGARYVSLRKGAGNDWTIEVLPDKGAYAASLTVLTAAAMTEYPLTVAPPLEPARKELGPADFARWRQDRSRRKDAVGTSLQGYVEDYIYAANYLAVLQRLKTED